jgi:hypothetical protein
MISLWNKFEQLCLDSVFDHEWEHPAFSAALVNLRVLVQGKVLSVDLEAVGGGILLTIGTNGFLLLGEGQFLV